MVTYSVDRPYLERPTIISIFCPLYFVAVYISLPGSVTSSAKMAPPGTLSTEDKSRVKKCLSGNNKIIDATVARVYQASQGESS